MAWFKKVRKPIETPADKSVRVPEGLWVKCPSCAEVLYHKDLVANLQVCKKCGHHFRVNAADRLRMLFDDGVWQEYDGGLVSTDPLKFTDTKPYKDRLKAGAKSRSSARRAASAGSRPPSPRWSTASSAAAWASSWAR